jgi:RNA 2',3'-cyclic 3'-phosphodiesterase
VRGFLAVPVLPPAEREVQELLEELRSRVPEVRWVWGDAPHITVHFFGSMSEDEARLALESVRPVAARFGAFALQLDVLGTFPSRGAARVLWIGCRTPPGALLRLAAACSTALRASGFAVEERQYRPHCTLGRPRDPWPDTAREAWHSFAASFAPLPPFSADALVLYESHTRPDGAVHVPLARLGLAGSARPLT